MRGHIYTAEENEFIRANYSNVGECVKLFNARFETNLSYSALKCHAMRKLGIRTVFRPWTKDMNESLAVILSAHSYRDSTVLFNAKWGTSFTQKQIQDHCTRGGIKRGFAESRARVDELIRANIGKTYDEIRLLIESQLGIKYTQDSVVSRRANNQGLSRPHRVWNNKMDARTINGIPVTYSEYVRFIGNRWHRISPELQGLALQVVRLQAMANHEQEGV